MPTYQCNLRCPYCFQDHMRTNPAYRHLLTSMDQPMVDRIWRGMDQIDLAHGLDLDHRLPRAITLFGGEPLLAESRPIIDYLMKKARETGGAHFSAVSNATDLHVYRDVLGPGGIAAIQVTIDGPPREHDQRRIYADGSGSFDRIAENVTLALECGTKISLRMNVDRGNVVQLPELAEEFQRRGWTGHRTSPPMSPRSTPPRTTWTSARRSIAGNSARQSPICSDGSLQWPSSQPQTTACWQRTRMLFEKRSDPLPLLRSSFCGAHTTMYVIDPFADIYACWERTGEPATRIGAIAEDGTVRTNSALFNTWRRRNVTTNPVCRKCRYATYCGGGGAAYAEQQHGDMFTNFCDGFGKRFRENVAHAYADFVSGVKRPRAAATSVCDL